MSTSTGPTPGGVGRRARATGRRPGVGALLLLLLPAVGLGAAALAEGDEPRTPAAAPDGVPLPAADLGCGSVPPGPSRAGDPPVLVSSGAGTRSDGTLSVGPAGGGSGRPVDVRAGGTQPARGGAAAAVVSADGASAAALLAARPWGASGWAPCAVPVPEVWFAGVGAGPEHSSVLELVNPDAGDAVVDVAVLGPTGAREVDAVRGVRVPGRASVALDLAALAPTRDELALRVVVARGRAAVQLRDRVDDLGRGPATTDLAPPQSAPAEEVLLLGLPEGRGPRVLTVANPGDDEVQVELAVVDARSTFVPVGLEDLAVPPGGTESVDLGRVLGREVARGVLGLRVRAATPVVAALRQVVDGDLVHAAPGTALAVTGAEGVAALVPPGAGPASLVLAPVPGGGTTTVDVVVRDAGGAVLRRRTVEVAAGTAGRLALPRAAARVEVGGGPGAAGASGSVVRASSRGAVVAPLVPQVATSLLPQVRPAP